MRTLVGLDQEGSTPKNDGVVSLDMSDEARAARVLLGNAVNVLVGGMSGQIDTNHGNDEACLRMAIRWARGHIDNAERALNKPSED